MRRKDKMVTDSDVIKRVIDNAQVCRLGLVDGDRPYIIPMNFGFDGTYIYLHSATGGKKVDLLQRNKNVCLEFEQDVQIIPNEQPCNWGAHYLTVIVHGEAMLIEEWDEKSNALACIVQQYDKGSQVHVFSEEQCRSVLVYRVNPCQMIGKISGFKI